MNDLSETAAARPQLPEAFLERMQAMLGGESADFLESYSGGEARALRFRTEGPASGDEFVRRVLHRIGSDAPARPVPWASNAWYLAPDSRPGREIWHELGAYYIQEPSAMCAASILDPRPGERVLDLCAAPGGKSTQLAGAMRGEGLLVANEIHPARSRILARNIERMGIRNCLVTNEAPGRLSARLPAFFDRVLVDAPCSGEGMFHKNPEAVLEWSPEAVEACAARQDEILEDAWKMLRPGGRLVYSTCTFSPQENEGTISRLLARHRDACVLPIELPWFSDGRPEWGDGSSCLSRTKRLWPHRLQGEGHFAALLQKAEEDGPHRDAGDSGHVRPAGPGGTSSGKKPRSSKTRPVRTGADRNRKVSPSRLVADFFKDILVPEVLSRIETGNLICFGDNLWLLPEEAPSLEGIRVLHAGLPVGILCKDRLEPAHGLAAALEPQDFLCGTHLSPDTPEAYAWMRGEALAASETHSGWMPVWIDSLGAGWGKCSGRQMKNHLPKGLRWPR